MGDEFQFPNASTPLFQNDQTSMSVAAEKGYTRIVTRLIAAGADPCAKDKVCVEFKLVRRELWCCYVDLAYQSYLV